MVIPFINFKGEAKEAIAFYETIFKVKEKVISYYKDMPTDLKPNFPRETDDYVMHSEMKINGTLVWIGDYTQELTFGDMISLAVTFRSKKEVQTAFEKLKDEGSVMMELRSTFYSPLFGVVKDKFGIVWHLMCQE